MLVKLLSSPLARFSAGPALVVVILFVFVELTRFLSATVELFRAIKIPTAPMVAHLLLRCAAKINDRCSY